MTETQTRALVRRLVGQLVPGRSRTIESWQALETDLKYDSLTMVELFIRIEDEFGFDPLAGEELPGLRTVADIEDYVLLRRAGAPPREAA
jgi:acyl carrier protein